MKKLLLLLLLVPIVSFGQKASLNAYKNIVLYESLNEYEKSSILAIEYELREKGFKVFYANPEAPNDCSTLFLDPIYLN